MKIFTIIGFAIVISMAPLLNGCANKADYPDECSLNVPDQSTLDRQKVIQSIVSNAQTQGIILNRSQLEEHINKYALTTNFGISWDDLPKPDLTNSQVMVSIVQFVKTNGWTMYNGDLYFYKLSNEKKPLTGLPWKELAHGNYLAITHKGILYVPLRGASLYWEGVAYNPEGKPFTKLITGYKALGYGWYAWQQETGLDPNKNSR